MRTGLLAVLATFLLSACFASDTPVIAPADLAHPADLEGRYWRVDPDDDVSIGLTRFRRAGSGFMADNDDDDDPGDLRLILSHPPDLYTMIDDSDGGRSLYFLMRREHGHVWRLLDMDIDDEGAFADRNVAFFDRVASKYGFSIKAGGEATPIEGPVKNGRIAELMRDPEFLGAVRIKDMAVYLPMLDPEDAPLELSMTDEKSAARALQSSAALPPGTRYADPAGFAGFHLESSDEDLRSVEFRRQDDGRFALYQNGRFDSVVGLLPLSTDPERYAAVEERKAGTDADTRVERAILLVERSDKGWIFTRIKDGEQRSADELNALRTANMQAAARREGLDYANHALSGPLTAERLVALLRDGQFTSGLRTDLDATSHYISAAAAGTANVSSPVPPASLTNP